MARRLRLPAATIVWPMPDLRAVQAALDAMTGLNRAWFAGRRLPPLDELGVRYVAERAGVERWQTAPVLLAARRGDCEDLACFEAAQLGGRAVAVLSPAGVHVVVQLGDGRITDPSVRLGMPT